VVKRKRDKRHRATHATDRAETSGVVWSPRRAKASRPVIFLIFFTRDRMTVLVVAAFSVTSAMNKHHRGGIQIRIL